MGGLSGSMVFSSFVVKQFSDLVSGLVSDLVELPVRHYDSQSLRQVQDCNKLVWMWLEGWDVWCVPVSISMSTKAAVMQKVILDKFLDTAVGYATNLSALSAHHLDDNVCSICVSRMFL